MVEIFFLEDKSSKKEIRVFKEGDIVIIKKIKNGKVIDEDTKFFEDYLKDYQQLNLKNF